MPDRHKHPPLSLRLPEAEREWLYAYARRTGQPVRRLLLQALRAWARMIDPQAPVPPPEAGRRRPPHG